VDFCQAALLKIKNSNSLAGTAQAENPRLLAPAGWQKENPAGKNKENHRLLAPRQHRWICKMKNK
jgi:hypothetical protein